MQRRERVGVRFPAAAGLDAQNRAAEHGCTGVVGMTFRLRTERCDIFAGETEPERFAGKHSPRDQSSSGGAEAAPDGDRRAHVITDALRQHTPALRTC